MTDEITTKDKLRSSRSELTMRRSLYPRWVKDGRMTQERADRGIALMEAIVKDYETLVAEEKASQDQQGKLL